MDQREASDTGSPRYEERAVNRQAEASAKARAHASAEQEWERGTTPKIMVAGLGGVGKSTLVNRLFGLGEEESVAEEGCSGKATTKVVKRYRHQLKNGVEAIIFDTPGFDDPGINEYRILADMQLKSEEKEKKEEKEEEKEGVDLLLYCVSMASPATRVTQGDVRALCLLTNVFGSSLWKKAIFVVTFANFTCVWAKKDQYDQLKLTIHEELRKQLKDEARVPKDTVAEIPLAAAGYTESMIKHEGAEDWVGQLFGLLIRRNAETATALLKGGMSTKEKFLAFFIQNDDVVTSVGALTGAAAGGVVGLLGGPKGIHLGAAIGGAIGTGLIKLVVTSNAAVTWKRVSLDKGEFEKQKKQLEAELKKDELKKDKPKQA